MRSGKGHCVAFGNTDLARDRPLSVLLSQALVAFTVEFDNEFERRMSEAGHAGTLLSLVVWSNLMRFLAEASVPVRELAALALAPEKRVKFELGCLERWGLVALEADSSDHRPIPTRAHRRASRILRDGWGSGRGIRSGLVVRVTDKGRKASEIWPPLFGEIERRWRERFSEEEIGGLRQVLEGVIGQLDVELPQGLPSYWEAGEVTARNGRGAGPLPLPALLSQLLMAFTIEFDGNSRAPLILCANTLRVLGERPIPVADIPRLTGGSQETSGIGWLKRWEARFGKDTMRRLEDSLRGLFVPRGGDRLLLSEGLVPAEGTVRAGEQAPRSAAAI